MLFNRNLPTRCQKTSLRAFIFRVPTIRESQGEFYFSGKSGNLTCCLRFRENQGINFLLYGAKWSLTCRMLCAYSIGAPTGAGQIPRENHYCSLVEALTLIISRSWQDFIIISRSWQLRLHLTNLSEILSRSMPPPNFGSVCQKVHPWNLTNRHTHTHTHTERFHTLNCWHGREWSCI